MLNNNKLYNFIDALYTYFKVSFYFWLYLLRGFIFYGLIPSTCALFLTIHFLNEKKEEGNIKERFKAYYKQNEKYNIPSLVFSFLFFFLYVSLIFLSKHLENPISLVLIIVVGYALILLSVLFVYCMYFLCFHGGTFKQSMMISFVTAIRNLRITLLILLINIVLVYMAKLNLAFFVVFGPFLFGLGMRFVLRFLNNVNK
jgi:uncharacterized membrane protein YesL